MYKNNIIPRGWRNNQNKLWYFPLEIVNEYEQVRDYKKPLVNNVYEKKSQAQPASFLHATCFNPVKSTLTKAVKNVNFATCPWLTSELITANLPKLEANVFGNLDQTRKNLLSTKSEQLELRMENDFPKREENNNCVFAGLANPDTEKTYTDLTGRLPVTSNRRMKYMLILYT